MDRSLATACFARDGWRCRHCNDRNALHPHHLVYRSHGGPDTLGNLLTLCCQCHNAHHEGKLEIVIVIQAGDFPVVRFQRKQGWRPH